MYVLIEEPMLKYICMKPDAPKVDAYRDQVCMIPNLWFYFYVMGPSICTECQQKHPCSVLKKLIQTLGGITDELIASIVIKEIN